LRDSVASKQQSDGVLLPPVAANAHVLQGQFVVEVGVRQAWPFVTFCASDPSETSEIRLYIGTTFRLDTGRRAFEDGDAERAAGVLLELNNRTVTDVQTSEANELLLSFDGGERALVIAGTAASFTTHDVWWLAER
jgi:hypothetical protein